MRVLRTIRIAAIAGIVLLVFATGVSYWLRAGEGDARSVAMVVSPPAATAGISGGSSGKIAGAPAPAPQTGGLRANVAVGGPFSLVDHTGRAVTDETFAGKLKLVFFGYTHCPDVCPTTLNDIARTLDILGDATSRQVAALFITLDPARDTAKSMADYVAFFHEGIVGLSGTQAQIDAAAQAYRVYYSRSDKDNAGAYTMDHSALIYLMGGDGDLITMFKFGTPPEEIAKAVRRALALEAS